MDRGAWQTTVWVAKSQTQLSDWTTAKPLWVRWCFSTIAFNILPLSLIFRCLTMICIYVDLFVFITLGFCSTFWTYTLKSSAKFGDIFFKGLNNLEFRVWGNRTDGQKYKWFRQLIRPGEVSPAHNPVQLFVFLWQWPCAIVYWLCICHQCDV